MTILLDFCNADHTGYLIERANDAALLLNNWAAGEQSIHNAINAATAPTLAFAELLELRQNDLDTITALRADLTAANVENDMLRDMVDDCNGRINRLSEDNEGLQYKLNGIVFIAQQ